MSIFARPALAGLSLLPAALLLGMPAAAQPQDETVITASDHVAGTVTRSLKVSFADLDLGDAHDQARFARRISAAADAVCADQPDTLWQKFAGTERSRCYEQAVASAMPRRPAGSQPASN